MNTKQLVKAMSGILSYASKHYDITSSATRKNSKTQNSKKHHTLPKYLHTSSVAMKSNTIHTFVTERKKIFMDINKSKKKVINVISVLLKLRKHFLLLAWSTNNV